MQFCLFVLQNLTVLLSAEPDKGVQCFLGAAALPKKADVPFVDGGIQL